jgi:hypothetical protein
MSGSGIIWKSGYHLEKRISSGKAGIIWKSRYHLKKQVSLEKVGIILKEEARA